MPGPSVTHNHTATRSRNGPQKTRTKQQTQHTNDFETTQCRARVQHLLAVQVKSSKAPGPSQPQKGLNPSTQGANRSAYAVPNRACLLLQGVCVRGLAHTGATWGRTHMRSQQARQQAQVRAVQRKSQSSWQSVLVRAYAERRRRRACSCPVFDCRRRSPQQYGKSIAQTFATHLGHSDSRQGLEKVSAAQSCACQHLSCTRDAVCKCHASYPAHGYVSVQLGTQHAHVCVNCVCMQRC